jgi:UDP-GlcNAc:undecaprenyl-phosphate GlcNAc-1-phosphate transferase
MMIAIITFFASFILSSIAVALVLRVSHKKSWYDPVNERKIHTGNIPRLGGIGFVSAFVISTLCIGLFVDKSLFSLRFVPVLLAMILVLASGVYDDFRPIAPRYKLLIQITAALCVIIPGFTFHQILYSGGDFFLKFNWIRYPLTFIWIVGLTNAINFIDGLDGLAGGISALAALTLAFISFSNSSVTPLICICLAGSIGGFLIFNIPCPRARLFMGDGGSQFLGFTLAILPLAAERNSPAALPVPYAAALLAIPIFDIVAAIWRRLRDGRRIDSPDKFHIHHKLINLNLKTLWVDLILWGLQVILGVLVYLAVKTVGRRSLLILGLAYLVTTIFFTVIHFLNRRALRRFTGTERAEDEVEAVAE